MYVQTCKLFADLEHGSPESVADSAAAEQQATEIKQLKKQLEAANLQLSDKDSQLAVATADHHNLH